MADDKPQQSQPPAARRPAVGLQIKLPCATAEELKARYGAELGAGTLFVRTKAPKPVGTLVRFDLCYASGQSALRGVAVVTTSDTPETAPNRPGMLLQLKGLDQTSHELLRAQGITLQLPVLRLQSATEPPPARPARAPAQPPASEPASTPAAHAPTTPPPAPDLPSLPPAPAVGLDLSTLPAAPASDPSEPTPGPVSEPTPGPGFLAPPSARKPARKGPVVGIDLGTSNSCVASMLGGKPFVIPSREGYNTVPSVIAVNEKARTLVGHPAKSQLLTNPHHTVYGAKRLVGRPFHSPIVSQLRERFPYEIVEGPRGEAAVQVGGKAYTLQEVSALILKEVREIARAKLGQDVTRAVITVPAYYNDHQRNAVREAGELAGLYVEQIVNEPTAAALAFGHGRNLEQRVLVYDLGGGTFDVSVLELHGGNVYEVVSTGGDTFLGGVDFDLRLLDVLLERFQQQHGKPFDGDRVALQRLLDAAERAKMVLSEAKEAPIHVPFVALDGDRALDLRTVLKRTELEQATAHLIDRTLVVTSEVLANRGLRPTDIDEVLLVGGQSRMPLVRERLKAFFGKEPSKSVHADEAVALGAALLAHSIQNEQSGSVVLIDVLPMSIGVGLPGGRFKKILERNTALPHTKSHTIATTKDDQTTLEIPIFQGESERAVENEFLGSVKVDGLPKAPRGAVKVDVTFKLSKESLLTVSTREEATGGETLLQLATRDTPDEVRRKLADLEPPPAPKTGMWGFFKKLFGRSAA